MIERTIAATTHGRFLIAGPSVPGPAPVLVGFHGYAELAEAQLDRMRAIPGAERWLLISIQGLNRFYQRRSNEVVAGWMTRQHRELAIADNLAYVNAVIDGVRREWPTMPAIVFAGFSQGVAMAFRAAAVSSSSSTGAGAPPPPPQRGCRVGDPGPARTDADASPRSHSPRLGMAAGAAPASGVIAVGGDVPPEIDSTSLAGMGPVLVCHGKLDQWYTSEIFERDMERLRSAGVDVRGVEFDAGHEWAEDVLRAASSFLTSISDNISL